MEIKRFAVYAVSAFATVYGAGWLLRSYTDLYATHWGDLLTGLAVGLTAYVVFLVLLKN